MEARRNPYTKFDDHEYDINGVPRQCPPPYSPGAGQMPHGSVVVVTQPTTLEQPIHSPPSSFMWLSAISCCFCWPMAICAIYLSNESVSAAGRGDYETARNKGRSAMGIAIAAISTGVILTVIVVMVKVLAFEKEGTQPDSYNYRYNDSY